MNKNVRSFSPLLFLLTLLPLPVQALAPNCSVNGSIFKIIAFVLAIVTLFFIIIAIVLFTRYIKHRHDQNNPKKLPLPFLIVTAILIAISLFIYLDALKVGPIYSRLDDCGLGFKVYTSENKATLSIDTLTNKETVKKISAIQIDGMIGDTETFGINAQKCIHVGTDGHTVAYEVTYCGWVEDAYPRFYRTDGSKFYTWASTLNGYKWDQRDLLEYFKLK